MVPFGQQQLYILCFVAERKLTFILPFQLWSYWEPGRPLALYWLVPGGTVMETRTQDLLVLSSNVMLGTVVYSRRTKCRRRASQYA